VAISAAEVRRIAKLARLRLTDEEAARLEVEFPRILDLVAGLPVAAVETSEPAEVPENVVLREDEPKSFPEPELLLSLAPEREGDFYKIKKVIE
jgi:aspartyl-tRNA(Asn)/glutamyl-tRNA(Gln) amidotransferase subunit C